MTIYEMKREKNRLKNLINSYATRRDQIKSILNQYKWLRDNVNGINSKVNDCSGDFESAFSGIYTKTNSGEIGAKRVQDPDCDGYINTSNEYLKKEVNRLQQLINTHDARVRYLNQCIARETLSKMI